jgi:hypothetical protein
MAKNFYPANDAEFALWLANFSNKTNINKAILGISGDQLTALASGLQDFNTDLALKQQKQEESVAQTSKVRDSRKSLNKLVGQLNALFKTNDAVASSLIEELGLNSSENSLNALAVNTPSDLVVNGTSDGINHLKWNRGNNRQGTLFIVEVKTGEATNYVMVDAVTNSAYEHKNQTPGVKATYRIKGKRGEIESGYSNNAVVY